MRVHRFHKVQRRRREKAGGVREGGCEEERAEQLRARERMTLRHSRQAKWAREVLARGKRDEATRAALSEHTQRGHTLSQHRPPSAESEGER